ncbi:hypothetical protein ALC60_03750, partial [Trachymyrmex zeteki]
ARIQITSSNATLATTTTLAWAVLYAKRSCNPALAGRVSLSDTPIHCRKSTNLQSYWLSSEDCSFLFLANRRIELSDTDSGGRRGMNDQWIKPNPITPVGLQLWPTDRIPEEMAGVRRGAGRVKWLSRGNVKRCITCSSNVKLVALNFVDETHRENGKAQTTEDEEELYSLTKVRKGVLCCRKWGGLHASSGLDTALPVCSSITWPSLRISDTLQKYKTILPADSEVCHQCHRHHSLCTIRLFYTVAKDLHVLILRSRHVLQVHGPTFKT